MCFNKADSLSPFGAGGINTRSYCEGDPINNSDPTGHFGGKSEIEQLVEDGMELLIDMLQPEALAVEAAVDATADATVDAILADVFSEDPEILPTRVAEGSNRVDALVEQQGQAAADTQSPIRSTAPKTQENIGRRSTATAPKRSAEEGVGEPLTKRSKQEIREQKEGKWDDKLDPAHFDCLSVWEFMNEMYNPRGVPEGLEPDLEYAKAYLNERRPELLKKISPNITVKTSQEAIKNISHHSTRTGIVNKVKFSLRLYDYNPGSTIFHATSYMDGTQGRSDFNKLFTGRQARVRGWFK